MATRKPEERLDGIPIADTAIRQPVFVTMLVLLVITFGLLAYTSMPVNLLPDFEVPIVAVTVAYPGAGPESVAEQVARPIEDTVNTINGIRNITSNSNEGITTIVLEFEEGTDIFRADQDVREKVNAIRPTLPRDIRDPIFQRFDPNQLPIMSIAIATDGSRSPLELRQLIDNEIVPQLQRAEGVGSVTVTGGQERQINVLMDLEKIQAYQILPVQISRSLQAANTNFGLGTITTDGQDISLRAPSLLQTPDDIAQIQITGTPYRIGDVAAVEDGVANTESFARLNGKDAIIIDILKQSGTNTVQVADNVKAQIERVLSNRSDLSYFIPRDQSIDVRNSVASSLEELFFASLAAFLVVWFFFRDLRNTFITMIGLPVIMIGTFAFMQVFGLTINLITLLALSLCVGLVIDDAIVVRENIYRRLQRGESPHVASSRGTAEVSLSVLAMTLTIVAVFVPVTFTSGTTGIVFKSFGITVAVAILLSLVEAYTFAPMMSANLFKKQKVKPHIGHHGGEVEQSFHQAHLVDDGTASLLHEAQEDPGRMGRAYERILAWSLRSLWNRLAIVVVALIVLGASVYVASGLKFSFFPEQDPHEFVMGFEMPAGTALAETDRLAQQAEAVLLQDPVVESVISTVGFPGRPERVQFAINLKGRTPTKETQERLRAQLAFLPDLAFSTPSFQGSSTAVTSRDIQLSLQTTRPIEELAPLLQDLETRTQGIAGLVDIGSTYNPGKPELRFVADPARIGDLGITNEEIASSVRALINGERATVLRQSGQDTDVVVRLAPEDRSSVETIRNIMIPTRSGSVPLSTLGTIEVSSSPTTIRRYDRLNQVIIGANVSGRNANDVVAEITAALEANPLPPDISWSFVGATQQQTEGFESLLLAMGLSVLFVYMVLASQFGSFLQPLVIMLAMPFSFIGAFLGLRLTGIDLDITGMIGLIMLLGLVVKNSILLVDFTNRLRRAGLEKHAALELAGAIRLRPILMTTLSLVAGALPVALGIHVFGTGEGSEFRKGLAVVLIGGLLTSMLLTLLVVPTAYSLLDSFTQGMRRLFRLDRDDDHTVPQPASALATGSALVTVAASTNGNGSSNGHETVYSTSNGQEAHHDTGKDMLRGAHEGQEAK